jgi:hypothetical protein
MLLPALQLELWQRWASNWEDLLASDKEDELVLLQLCPPAWNMYDEVHWRSVEELLELRRSW